MPTTLKEALHILRLAWPCSGADAKAAFRTLAKKHHPDHGGNAAQFRRVYRAYEIVLARTSG